MRRKHLIDLAMRRASPSSARSVATEEDIATVDQERPRRTGDVRFEVIPEHQLEMHGRLENWANAGRGGDKQSGKAAPMFLLYRSGDAKRAYGEATAVPVNRQDAMQVAKGVIALPEKHRDAINWYYLHPKNPRGMASALGQSLQGLADLVIEGRQHLINRGV